MHNDPSLSDAAKDQISVLGDAYNTHDKATFFSKLKGSNPGAAGHCKREGVDDDGNCGHLSRNGSAIYLNPLPAPVTLRVTGARRVLVTAASRSCALASKLRL